MNECDIFMAALAKGSLHERQAFLDEACAGDANLKRRIESLFESHDQAGSLLEQPALGVAPTVNSVQGEISTDGGADGAGRPAKSPDAISLNFLAPADDSQALGRLGPYTVTEIIGRGGMGIVLKAHDRKLNRVVAIKVLAPELAANPTAKKRFLREAQAAAAVVHQHVVTIHAVDDDRPPYLVMEYIDGPSLQEKIDRAGHLELKEILRIGQQVAAGLAAAHGHGLMHRDVKPANILLENGVQRVRITDFGLARTVDDVSMTKPGEVAGTPQYMSPEQAQGLPMDARSDLFSLGSVLYAMSTGRPPFRAETMLATVRRVCEDTPRPIREVNPEIPAWLVAIIDRLLAKQPTERYQTAAEVAQLLGQHLADLQHPGLPTAQVAPAPQPKTQSPKSKTSARHWLLAAAVAVVLLLGLSLTEATGVTKLAPTLLRIVTGEGTLLVEVNDPGVKVTVEGDGGLVISGAGLHEVHLKPGNYQLRADKDGQRVPLSQELVTITRGDKQVVRVRLEAESPPAVKPVAAVPVAELQPFVVLSGQVAVERKYDTLSEAVLRSDDGDTIEIRGNGPFLTRPIRLPSRRTIRASEGFRPVFIFDVERSTSEQPRVLHLLETRTALVLEGLEFRNKPDAFGPSAEIYCWDAPLYVANCRFIGCLVALWRQPACQLRNSQFSNTYGYAIRCIEGSAAVLDNNIVATCGPQGVPLALLYPDNVQRIDITRNVIAGQSDGIITIFRSTRGGPAAGPAPLHLSHNIVSGPAGILRSSHSIAQGESPSVPLEAAEIELLLRERISWHEAQNLYSTGTPLLSLSRFTPTSQTPLGPTQKIKTLDDWNKFWGQSDSRSIQGVARFQGGDAVHSAPHTLAPDDFRLRSDSAGFRAGPGGKDLGPDIDLVGPGEAYERWKKTPAYEEWQRSVRQAAAVRPVAAIPNPAASQPFVVLGRQSRAEQKLAALAAALQKSSAGDTIEIRGNGPFTIQPMRLTSARVIRAGQGFSPVIKVDAQAVPTGNPARFFESTAPLVLEGLEFQPVSPNSRAAVTTLSPVPSDKESGALYVSNCRFSGCSLMAQFVSACQIRNCAVYQDGSTIGFYVNSARLHAVVDNNIVMPSATGAAVAFAGIAGGQRLTLTRNFLGGTVNLSYVVPGDETAKAIRPVSLESSQNVWCRPSAAVWFSAHKDLPSPGELSSGDKLEMLLRQVIGWQEHSNLYPAGVSLLSLSHDRRGTLVEPKRSYQSLAEWNQFWGMSDTASIQGAVRCQGGDVLQKLALAPEKVTLQDFRLRDDSPGYRAGADGKDLGPDIDLVGPGEAYDRWKQTPEYQVWLKETGQLRADIPPAQAGAFVILGSKNTAEQKLDSLAEAVQKCSDGDTIEIRGNGPFVTPQLTIATALTIRAGAGNRPVIQADQGGDSALRPHFKVTGGPLTLEGLEFRGPAADSSDCNFAVKDVPCYVANCRFSRCTLTVSKAPSYQVRNSHFSTTRSSSLLVFSTSAEPNQVVENNLITDSLYASSIGAPTEIRRNLVMGTQGSIAVAANPKSGQSPVGLHLSQNIFVGSPVLRFSEAATGPLRTTGASGAELEAVLRTVVDWQEDGNLYVEGARFFSLSCATARTPNGGYVFTTVEPSRPYNTLSDWNEFWGQSDTKAVQGRVQFQGGDAALAKPFTLEPDDFRLREDSAGYRAGPDGKDLGPDIDLVGPGAAYERWKKTPEYEKWLKETGQK